MNKQSIKTLCDYAISPSLLTVILYVTQTVTKFTKLFIFDKCAKAFLAGKTTTSEGFLQINCNAGLKK